VDGRRTEEDDPVRLIEAVRCRGGPPGWGWARREEGQLGQEKAKGPKCPCLPFFSAKHFLILLFGFKTKPSLKPGLFEKFLRREKKCKLLKVACKF
jgi:hypothetical protein